MSAFPRPYSEQVIAVVNQVMIIESYVVKLIYQTGLLFLSCVKQNVNVDFTHYVTCGVVFLLPGRQEYFFSNLCL